jgi:hypothetical protein
VDPFRNAKRLAPARSLEPRQGQRQAPLSPQRVSAPDLGTVKDFLHFYVAVSRNKVVKKPTAIQ